MVKQGIYIYAWPSVYNADLRVFFDKLTVKPKQQRKCRPYHKELTKLCFFNSALSVRMLESVEPFSTITPQLSFESKKGGFDDIN